MNPDRIKSLLESVSSGSVSPEDAFERLRALPFEDLGFAKVDHHRSLRQGVPEVIFAQGKTPAQVAEIVGRMRAHGSNVLATRCSNETVAAVKAAHPDVVHHEAARALTLTLHPPKRMGGYVGIVCAGTSDIPVAEEAVVTCESMGATARRVYDVGVAGIHRLFNQHEALIGANALVVCAGMEGALPSVVAGLVDIPVIAVPTSVGYGANLGGVTALLAMLNSCATGVSVVNIDNGFGAGMLAAMINRLADRAPQHETKET
ncbi:MAG: nickel pincer cofactor biosynthesis protein LarB [Candidatus Hydrogenedentes bacterium]|nr:nickel pincer cofactor biosynthesis protein LarB [Candidatus Hydrogenedentota bacterium]